MLTILGNDRCNRRQFVDLGAAQRPGIRQVVWQGRLAAWTVLRLKLNWVLHLLGRDEWELVPLVTELATGFAPTWGTWG